MTYRDQQLNDLFHFSPQAYFSGVLTMFFSVGTPVKFTSMAEVVSLEPEWTVLALQGLIGILPQTVITIICAEKKTLNFESSRMVNGEKGYSAMATKVSTA